MSILQLTSAVNTVSSLQLRAKTDGGPETNDGGLALLLARLRDGVVDALEVAARVVNTRFMPT